MKVPARALELSITPDHKSLGHIHSLYAQSGRLYIGYASGTLQVYDISNPHTPDITARLDQTLERFANGPAIDQIGSIGDVGVLIVLDGSSVVSLYDMDTLELSERLPDTKGATQFATSQEIIESIAVSRLAIACKRKVFVYEWRESQFDGIIEFAFQESVKSLCFATQAESIVCGTASRFYTCNLSTKAVSPVQEDKLDTASSATQSSLTSMGMSYISRMYTPTCLCISTSGDYSVKQDIPSYDDRRQVEALKPVVIIRDNRAKLINSHGRLIKYEENLEESDAPSYQDFVWPSNPRTACYSRPYLVTALSDHIELSNVELGTNLQSINIANVRAMTTGKLLYAATNTSVYRILLETDFNTLVEQMATDISLHEAISLLNQVEPVLVQDRETTLRDLQMRRGLELFKAHNFERALLLFSDISAPPNLVVSLYPPDFLTNPSAHNDDISQENMDRAIRALLPYLADTRRKIDKLAVSHQRVLFHGFELSEEIYGDIGVAATLVDTTLFRCYTVTGSSLVGPLLRLPNNCDPDIVQEALEKDQRWSDLVDFFYQRKYHRRALELLSVLGHKNTNNDRCLPTLQYLERLDDTDLELIFEFAEWPIKEDPGCIELLFMGETSESQSLPRAKVLKYITALDVPLNYIIQYLEFCISHGDQSSLFHNTLLSSYITSSAKTSTYDEKMLSFAESSPHIRVDRTLSELPATNANTALLQVKAILLDRKGLRSECLNVLVNEVGSEDRAREYCAKWFSRGKKDLGQRLLHELLQIYINLDNNRAVYELLASQGSRMSPKTVLESLKDDLSLTELQIFLQSHLRRLNNAHRKGDMRTSLLKVDLIRTQEELLEFSHKHSTITNHSTCAECKKRLGKSVTAILPNGDILHYGCLHN